MKKSQKTKDAPAERAALSRILVALDDSRQSKAALEAAASMAERLQAELEGMFIEDTDLLQMAALPFAHEIGFTSRSRRLLDSNIMARALRARASMVRKTFEDIASKHRLVSSFRVTRGQVLAELLAATEQVDLIAVGTTGHKVGRGGRPGATYTGVVESCQCSVLLLQEHVTTGRSVIVLFDGSDDAAQTLKQARSLARAQSDPLVIALLSGSDDPANLRQQAFNLVGDQEDVSFVELTETQLDDLPSVLSHYQCGVFLVPRATSRQEPRLNVERLAQLHCPVLLLSPR